MKLTGKQVTIALLAFGALAAVVVAVLFGLRPGGTLAKASSFTPAMAEKRIGECRDLAANAHQRQAADECLAAVLKEAVDTRSVAQVGLVLEKGRLTDKYIFDMCHSALHTAGEYGLHIGRDIRELILAGSNESCAGGFLHGVFYELPAQKPSEARMIEIAGACNDIEKVSYGASWECAHSFGHAAFMQKHDVPYAMTLCDHMSTPHFKTSCATAVMMQAFRADWFSGATSKEPVNDPMEAITLVPQWCADVQAEFGEHAPVTDGCYEYGAQAMTQTSAGILVQNYARQVVLGEKHGVTADEAVAMYKRGLDACAAYPAYRQKICRQSQATAMQIYTLQNTTVQDELCPRLGADLDPYCRGTSWPKYSWEPDNLLELAPQQAFLPTWAPKAGGDGYYTPPAPSPSPSDVTAQQ